MAWDFETEPEYQEKLDWVDRFMREDVEPLDYVLGRCLRQDGRAGAGGGAARCSSRYGSRVCGRPISSRRWAGRATGR